ncbi:hypothetical protein EV363DRAFT_1406551 [Boletus edulis]|nr:hypothetical protein EV363DRAFT_1406551 [Boletus edulis]
MSLAETAAGMDGTFTSIPHMDLSKCGTPEGRLATAYEIRDVCMGLDFLRNHGIPESCLDNVLAAAQTYFSLPMATRMGVRLYHIVTCASKLRSELLYYHRTVAN